MAGVPEKVLNWLYSVLPGEYVDVNRTYHDVAESLSHYPSLSPRTEVYTYENGASALLLSLSGTLPVTFRGTTYGFPVAIWVPHAYPRESPIVYVTPSQDMLVRPGQHVSGDGRIYHPYLAQWGKYWDKSTIYDFLAVLRGVFAKEPPVRSKQGHPSSSSSPVPPPVPPPPTEWRRSIQDSHVPSPPPRPSSQAPVPPPKPPMPSGQGGESSKSPSQQEGRYSRPPPLPPQISQQQEQPVQQVPYTSYPSSNNWPQQHPIAHEVPQRQAGHGFPVPPPGSRSLQSFPQGQAQAYHSGSNQLGSPVSPISPEDQISNRYQRPAPLPAQSVPVPASPQPYFTPDPQPNQHDALSSSQQTYQYPSHIYTQQSYPQYQQAPIAPNQPQPAPKPVPNLLDDSLEVTLPSQSDKQPAIPVPPVPPNPEKDALLRALSQTLTAQIRQTVASNTAAVAPLRAQQEALQNAYATLQSELEQLMQLDAALAANEQILKDTMREADRVMDEARMRQVPDVDEVLVAPTVVGGQLYSLAAEERGIADALFVLGRALDKGRVGCDVFVKQTRSLAREQFLKKALIKKIARGLALDEFQMR